jgi:hypothetical protein
MSCCHITCYCQYDHIGNDFYEEDVFDAELFDPEEESYDPEYDISSLRFEIDVAKHSIERYTALLADAQSESRKAQWSKDLTSAQARLTMLTTKLARFLELNPTYK